MIKCSMALRRFSFNASSDNHTIFLKTIFFRILPRAKKKAIPKIFLQIYSFAEKRLQHANISKFSSICFEKHLRTATS